MGPGRTSRRDADEGWLLIAGFINAAGMGLGFWLVYLALEPFARRRWPQMLVSWTRALSGRWRDPLVARDLLIGALVGTTSGLIMGPLRVLLPLRLGIPGPPPHPFAAPVTLRSGAGVAARVRGLRDRSGCSQSFFCWFSTRWIVRRGLVRRARRDARVHRQLSGGSVALGHAAARRDLRGILVAVTVRFGVLAAIASETLADSSWATGFTAATRRAGTSTAGMIAVAACARRWPAGRRGPRWRAGRSSGRPGLEESLTALSPTASPPSGERRDARTAGYMPKVSASTSR